MEGMDNMGSMMGEKRDFNGHGGLVIYMGLLRLLILMKYTKSRGKIVEISRKYAGNFRKFPEISWKFRKSWEYGREYIEKINEGGILVHSG